MFNNYSLFRYFSKANIIEVIFDYKLKDIIEIMFNFYLKIEEYYKFIKII